MTSETTRQASAAARRERRRHWSFAALGWDMAAENAKQPKRAAGYRLRQAACEVLALWKREELEELLRS